MALTYIEKQWKSIWNQLETSLVTNWNPVKISIEHQLNSKKYQYKFIGNPVKILILYQLKSPGNPFEISMKYQWKSIGNPVEIQ